MKLVFQKANGKHQAKSLPRTRVRGPDGKAKTMFTLDADSESFGADLEQAFAFSVRQARRENKRLTVAAKVAAKTR